MIWSDKGFLLSKLAFQENSIIANFFTKNHGKCSGIIYGATSKKIKNYLQKKFITRATFKYLENEENEPKIVICQNQTCSNKLTNIKEIEDYLKENKIN